VWDLLDRSVQSARPPGASGQSNRCRRPLKSFPVTTAMYRHLCGQHGTSPIVDRPVYQYSGAIGPFKLRQQRQMQVHLHLTRPSGSVPRFFYMNFGWKTTLHASRDSQLLNRYSAAPFIVGRRSSKPAAAR